MGGKNIFEKDLRKNSNQWHLPILYRKKQFSVLDALQFKFRRNSAKKNLPSVLLTRIIRYTSGIPQHPQTQTIIKLIKTSFFTTAPFMDRFGL